MKKIISSFLCLSLFISLTYIPVSATNEVTETENIEDFCDDINDMITEYADSEFVTPDFVEEQPTELSEPENEVKYLSRLIVQSNETINTYNALDVVSGFKNFYILQYANEQDTNYAYEQYKKDDSIISVSYDISYNALASVTENDSSTSDESITYEQFANDWTLTGTGMDMVLEKYKNANLPKITVAVIDTGVNLDSVYLSDRIVRTYYNMSGEGDKNTEQDTKGHGTSVSSVIMKTTTDNVKIANYCIIPHVGEISSITIICNALLQAISDGHKIINCSFMCYGNDELTEEVFKYAYQNECYIFFAAGNMLGNIGITSSSSATSSEYTVTVAMSTNHNLPHNMSAYGSPIDITAPGGDATVLKWDDTFEYGTGTSFASPFMAGVCAMYVATHPRASFEYVHKLMKRCGTKLDTNYITGYFGSGIVNALKLFELDKVSTPIFNYENGNYIGTLNIEIYAEEGSTIFYTIDNTYPSPNNGFVYTKPIICSEGNAMIRAVAYKNGYKSCFGYADYNIFTEGTDDMFTVTSDGILTSYTGNIDYLKIPEIINGITVKDIAVDIMSDSKLIAVYLPDTVKYIGETGGNYERPITVNYEQYGPFYNNQTLSLVVGDGIEIIGVDSFSELPKLTTVIFPNCKEIYPNAFSNSRLLGAEFSSVNKIWNCAFKDATFLRELYLPNCETFGDAAFSRCGDLTFLYAPNLKKIESCVPIDYYYDYFIVETGLFEENIVLNTLNFSNVISFCENAFSSSAVKKLELSSIKTVLNLPSDTKSYSNGTEASIYSGICRDNPIELIFPSTLESCVSAESYKREWNSYAVYGTKGTYAEQWAADNSLAFYEISQETAIREDIDTYWDKYSWQPLEFDARGFNRTYQWYGSYDNVIGNDKIISGANDKTFNPDNYKAYPYYYCMMTSTDGDSVVNIHSNLCQNRLYYIYDIEGTTIDYSNLFVFTTIKNQRNIDNIVGVQDTTTYFYVPSYIYRKERYYGTGSTLDVYADDDTVQTYTLILQGDVNGDSAVDVLDAIQVQKASSGKEELTDNYLLAADTDYDGTVSVMDYAQVVNLAVDS